MIVECEKAKLDVDFYQKTLHTRNYPTAQRPDEKGEFGSYDNAWCYNADEVIELMKTVKKPWIAFKVMAAGAIPPARGVPLRRQRGGRFRLGGHVRLADRRGRADRQASPGQGEPRPGRGGRNPLRRYGVDYAWQQS